MRFILVFLAASCAFGAEPQRLAAQSLPSAKPSVASLRAAGRILFNRIGPYETAIYIANADGTDEKPLLSAPGGLDYNPAYLADAAWVVFTSERDGSADLYRVKADGTGFDSTLERLTDHPAYDDQAAFSPDGRQIVFVSTREGGRANLWILDAATRAAKRLTSGEWGDYRPAWSPDGQWIAFSSDRETRFQFAEGRWEQLHLVDVYLIRPDGAGLRRLTTSGGACGSPRWSRDSKRLAAYCMPAQDSFDNRGMVPSGESLLAAIDVATGMVSEIPEEPQVPGVKVSSSFVGTGRVGYVRKEADAPGIFYTDGARGPRGIVRSASWSADGSRVVFHRILSSSSVNWRKTWSRDADFELVLTQQLPAFHPSGEKFLTTPLRSRSLELVETGGGAARVLYEQQPGKAVMAAQWSPDGNEVIFGLGTFFVQRARGAQVAMVKADGSGFRELTEGANNNGFPSFSPDGKQFVFRTLGPEGQGLRVMNLADKSVRTLTDDYDNFPLWSPRGDQIVFTRRHEGDFELFSVRPDGTDLRRLTSAPGNDSHCAWSPDGEWILFSSSRLGFKDEAIYGDSPQPYGELFLMRYDGAEVRQLTDNQWEDATPAWQPERQ
ncbi:MAG: TolB family protein [Terriglobia bacterium]